MESSIKSRRSRTRTVLKILIISLCAYGALATGMALVAVTKLRSLELSEVEVPPEDVVTPQDQLATYPAGIYGEGRPFRPLMFEGKMPQTTINDSGLRSPYNLDAKLGGHVVLLGDSFTFGYGLPDHQTLAAHLGKLDPARKYINAGQPLFNLHDAVTRFEQLWSSRQRPSLVLLQILLSNDIIAEQRLERNIQLKLEAMRPWRIPPFNGEWMNPILMKVIRDRLWVQLHADLTRKRFDLYIAGAIKRLRRAAGKESRVVLLYYVGSLVPKFKKMESWLHEYCRDNEIPLMKAEVLVGATPSASPRLSDGHPSGAYNAALARALKPELEAMLASASEGHDLPKMERP